MKDAMHEIIQFGPYQWRVLATDGRKKLLLSDAVLERRPYHNPLEAITWENCILRRYLNECFINKFDVADRNRIAEVTISTPDNLWYGTEGGNDTTDRIFLLSIEEADLYFGDSGDYVYKMRKEWDGKPDANGYFIYNDYNDNRVAYYQGAASWWWLRSPGNLSDTAATVNNAGRINVSGGDYVSAAAGVRPALWLNL